MVTRGSSVTVVQRAEIAAVFVLGHHREHLATHIGRDVHRAFDKTRHRVDQRHAGDGDGAGFGDLMALRIGQSPVVDQLGEADGGGAAPAEAGGGGTDVG